MVVALRILALSVGSVMGGMKAMVMKSLYV